VRSVQLGTSVSFSLQLSLLKSHSSPAENNVSIFTFLKKKITKDESRDTGMAMVLLLLILSAASRRKELVIAAIVLHVFNMVVPQLYQPIAILWLAFSDLVGGLVSKILMFVVFFAVVTPIGVLRRMGGKDSLKLRAFKKGDESVMLARNHLFTGRDLEKPY